MHLAWMIKTFLIVTLINCISANAQTIELVADINTSSETVGGEPSELVEYNGNLYYSADFYPYGRELYVYNVETETASLVADIKAGGGSSSPSSLIVYNDKLYFFADDGIHGEELFVYDSETNKVSLTADIQPGSESSVYHYGSWLTIYNEQLYFFADEGKYGRELYLYDDRTKSASLVADINEGGLSGIAKTSVKNIGVFNNKLYFGADDGIHGNELFSFDAASGEINLVADVVTDEHGSSPHSFAFYDDKLYFSANSDLFQYDIKTKKITRIFNSLDAYYAFNYLRDVVLFNNRLLFKVFRGGDQLYAEEKIFSYDLTQKNVEQIDQDIDYLCNPLDRLFSRSVKFDNQLYYTESEGGCLNIYRYDYTSNRIVKLLPADILTVPYAGKFVKVMDNHYFYTNNGVLTRYNNSTTHTDIVHTDTEEKSSYPNQLIVYENQLYFSARPETGSFYKGEFLYRYDSTKKQIEKVFNSEIDGYYRNPEYISVFGDKLIYYSEQLVNDDYTDKELNAFNKETNSFSTIYNDGEVNSVVANEQQLLFSSNCILYSYEKDILRNLVDLSDQANCSIHDITNIDNAIYFRNKSQNLYHYDLVSNELVHFFTGGIDTSYVNFNIVKYQGELYFPGNNFDGSGVELYRYNVETNLVELVADILDEGSSSPTNLMVYNNKLFFSAIDASARRFNFDRKLYVFDAEIDEVSLAFEQSLITNYLGFQLYQNKLYFVARSKDEGYDRAFELYAYDDFSKELTLVVDIYHTGYVDKVSNFAVLNNKLYFNADLGTHGSELYSLHINSAPEGSIDIQVTNNGSLTLMAVNNFEDADGVDEINYQWQRDEKAIEGAVDSSYVLTDIDVGKNISVIASYTDDNGTEEQVISVAPYLDSDGDGISDDVDTDDDNDGVLDSDVDTDGDGLGCLFIRPN